MQVQIPQKDKQRDEVFVLQLQRLEHPQNKRNKYKIGDYFISEYPQKRHK